MKRILCFMFIILSLNSFTQNKKKVKQEKAETVIIGRSPQEVPLDKEWIIKINKPTIVQIEEEKLEQMHEYSFLEPQQKLLAICEGEYLHRNHVYCIVYNYKDVKKIPYTNEETYSLTPIKIFDIKSNEEQDNLEFFGGQKVFVITDLISIEASEITNRFLSK